MARKCLVCGELIKDESTAIPYKNRLVHSNCFNNTMKVLKQDKNEQLQEKSKEKKKTKRKSTAKPKAELKDPVSEEEYADKKEYYQYIRILLQLDKSEKLNPKIYAVSERYISQYDFTFKNMYLTLVYINEIIEKEVKGDVVGLIPYYYSQAEEYYTSVKQVEENNKGKDINTMYHEKTIVISPKKRKIKQIDITSIC